MGLSFTFPRAEAEVIFKKRRRGRSGASVVPLGAGWGPRAALRPLRRLPVAGGASAPLRSPPACPPPRLASPRLRGPRCPGWRGG